MKNIETFEGTRYQANPLAVAVSPEHAAAMTTSRSRNGMAGTADRLPVACRAGSQDADRLPSRMGNKLVYRDGRVENI